MFPRVAALNVTDTHYRDSSINLGAALAFFGIGLNGAYNREHLRMSQVLGQSSYITGYGVGQSDFGWKFGIPLGNQIISSDIKRTFVLVRIPKGCVQPLVTYNGSAWMKPKKDVPVYSSGDELNRINDTLAHVSLTMCKYPDDPKRCADGDHAAPNPAATETPDDSVSCETGDRQPTKPSNDPVRLEKPAENANEASV